MFTLFQTFFHRISTNNILGHSHLYEINDDEAGAVAIGKQAEAGVDRETRDCRRGLCVHPGRQADLRKCLNMDFQFDVEPGLVESHQVSSQRLPAPETSAMSFFISGSFLSLFEDFPWIKLYFYSDSRQRF